eukprot:103036-Chlamydomonas_euryale.AAC.2
MGTRQHGTATWVVAMGMAEKGGAESGGHAKGGGEGDRLQGRSVCLHVFPLPSDETAWKLAIERYGVGRGHIRCHAKLQRTNHTEQLCTA